MFKLPAATILVIILLIHAYVSVISERRDKRMIIAITNLLQKQVWTHWIAIFNIVFRFMNIKCHAIEEINQKRFKNNPVNDFSF